MLILEELKSAVAIVFFKPNENDLLISLKNISKFSIAIVVWNSLPINLENLAKEKNIDLKETDIKIIVNDKNLGIGGGLNIALSFANKIGIENILTLDQDSFVTMPKDKIIKYFKLFVKIPNFGCLGFKRIKGKYDENYIYNLNKLKVKKLAELKNFKEGNLLNYSYMHSGTIYCVKSFINLGGFKQEYFMGFTDIEYSLRLYKNKLLYIDDPLIIHDAGVTNINSSNSFSFLIHPLWISYLEYRNLIITLYQNFFYAPKWSLKVSFIFITIIPFKIWVNHKSFLKLFSIIFCGISDGIISICLKRISLKTYNLILKRCLNFKIPYIQKFKNEK